MYICHYFCHIIVKMVKTKAETRIFTTFTVFIIRKIIVIFDNINTYNTHITNNNIYLLPTHTQQCRFNIRLLAEKTKNVKLNDIFQMPR
jgi:hypothetical protein